MHHNLFLKIITPVALLTALASTGRAATGDLTVQQASPKRFETGDAAFRLRGEREQAQLALDQYRKIFTGNPKDVEAAWRISMACHFMGLRYLKDDEAKKKTFAEGREAGLKALELEPACAACHFWTAINMALYGQTVGPFKSLFTLNSVHDHLEKSIAGDPGYAYGGAYRVLGVIEQKLPGILGGSDRRAKAYFKKAIENAPDEPLNYFFLARLLKENFDDPEGAIAVVKEGLKVARPPKDRLESWEAYAEIRDFAATLPPPKALVNE